MNVNLAITILVFEQAFDNKLCELDELLFVHADRLFQLVNLLHF